MSDDFVKVPTNIWEQISASAAKYDALLTTESIRPQIESIVKQAVAEITGENPSGKIECRVCGGVTRRSRYAYICQQEFGDCGVVNVIQYKQGTQAKFEKTRWKRNGRDKNMVEGIAIWELKPNIPTFYILPNGNTIDLTGIKDMEARWSLVLSGGFV